MEIYKKNIHKYSAGVLILGRPNIYEYIKNLINMSKLQIISIGSGNGAIENDIEKKFGINIICIDPSPLSWSIITDEYKSPEYETMEQLIISNNNLINNSNLFINWSFPTFDYDIESIILLKPKNIIIIVDLSPHHASGSFKLHAFMKLCGVKSNVEIDDYTMNDVKQKIKNNKLRIYNFIYRTYTKQIIPSGILELSIIWLSCDIRNNDINNIEVRNSDEYLDAVKEYNK